MSLQERIRAAFAALTPMQRLALSPRFVGRSREEVASALGISKHRVRNLRNEGKKRLKVMLPEWAGNELVGHTERPVLMSELRQI